MFKKPFGLLALARRTDFVLSAQICLYPPAVIHRESTEYLRSIYGYGVGLILSVEEFSQAFHLLKHLSDYRLLNPVEMFRQP